VGGCQAVGYPIPVVEDAGGVVTDAVDGRDVVVFAAGSESHAFENPEFAFAWQDAHGADAFFVDP